MRPVTDATVNVMDDDTSVTLAQREWDGSSPFTDAMREATLALDEERWDDAERELKEAHEAFPDYMAADAPLRRLIELYERLGKTEKLKAVLRQEIEWNQTDFPACRKLVELLRKEEDWAGAAEMADWALGIDPFDAPMRQSYLDSLLRSGDNTGALRVLSQLVAVDKPRATDYRLKRVEILIGEEEWPRARMEAVALLEDVPHFWEAQQMLLSIVEAGQAGPKVPAEPADR
ncbi:MAG: tetratricopeptide repeat protein [SAR324 cluster bacterium]|nr:tetratricopeptide repeat protein [SAR324 cluster bacterium]